jgi:hypothetical protein
VIGVLGAETGKGIGRAGVGQGASGLQIRQQHRFGGIENLGRLGHEVHAAEHDYSGVGAGGFAGQLERIADEISDVLNRLILVIVRQDHSVAPLFQISDRCRQVAGRRDRTAWAAGAGSGAGCLGEDQPFRGPCRMEPA